MDYDTKNHFLKNTVLNSTKIFYVTDAILDAFFTIRLKILAVSTYRFFNIQFNEFYKYVIL